MCLDVEWDRYSLLPVLQANSSGWLHRPDLDNPPNEQERLSA